MEVSADRAYGILNLYCRAEVRLNFGASMLGSTETCTVVVTSVWPYAHAITISVVDPRYKEPWEIFIPTEDGRFSFTDSQHDAVVEGKTRPEIRAVLLIEFPDGSFVCFGEQDSIWRIQTRLFVERP